jgi:hypothetical protein
MAFSFSFYQLSGPNTQARDNSIVVDAFHICSNVTREQLVCQPFVELRFMKEDGRCNGQENFREPRCVGEG